MDGRRCSSDRQIIYPFSHKNQITHDKMGGRNAAFFYGKGEWAKKGKERRKMVKISVVFVFSVAK